MFLSVMGVFTFNYDLYIDKNVNTSIKLKNITKKLYNHTNQNKSL